jgi:hypothetical protein
MLCVEGREEEGAAAGAGTASAVMSSMSMEDEAAAVEMGRRRGASIGVVEHGRRQRQRQAEPFSLPVLCKQAREPTAEASLELAGWLAGTIMRAARVI